jgi:phosphoglycerol transferase MdoB-like AlkP superfamily enzyme
MESWSADLIESLGGEPGITPEFRKLEKEGLLFRHLYASGNRSQQGIASLFSGFPAIPYTTITQNPAKYQKLPSMPMLLMDAGYNSSFYFGGDLNYGDIKAYALYNGIRKIVDEKMISDSIPRGRLGIHDEYMMRLHAREMNDAKQPFFTVLFTMSSHSPYDQPPEHTIEWDKGEELYVKSAFYSDYSLGQYFDIVRNEPWYDSTLFIIIADHSHNTYRNWPVESFNYRRIPMMLLGGALKDEYRGKSIDRISSNGDLPVTLLKQLGLDCSSFAWSRDLFNPYSKEYAYFEINDGVGWKTPKGEFIYNVRYDQYLYEVMSDGATEQDKSDLIRQGKSYVEVIFQTFLDM